MKGIADPPPFGHMGGIRQIPGHIWCIQQVKMAVVMGFLQVLLKAVSELIGIFDACIGTFFILRFKVGGPLPRCIGKDIMII